MNIYMKDALIILLAVALGAFITARRFNHRFTWFHRRSPRED
jgi:uncharacterized membrane protein